MTLSRLSYPTIKRIENGHGQPRWDTPDKLAAALGKSVRPVFVDRPVPRLGDLVDRWSWHRDGQVEPDWTSWRGFADELSLHSQFVGIAIAGPVLPSGSPLVDNLLAAMAEKLAGRRDRYRCPRCVLRGELAGGPGTPEPDHTLELTMTPKTAACPGLLAQENWNTRRRNR